MPTNPLWVEHTEKAAWDTVRALREQVEQERARSDALTRIEPTLPRIAELLEEAREVLSVETHAPVTVIEQLIERVRSVTEERDELRELLATRAVPVAPASGPAGEPAAPPPAPPPAPRDAPAAKPSAIQWFGSQLERRRREQELEGDVATRGGSLAEVAARVEEGLREMLPLPYAPRALRTAALDLGLAALELARAARRAQRSS